MLFALGRVRADTLPFGMLLHHSLFDWMEFTITTYSSGICLLHHKGCVPISGLEPLTFSLGERRSILLNYMGMIIKEQDINSGPYQESNLGFL